MASLLGAAQYAAATALVRGRLSRLLSQQVWSRLLSAEDTDDFVRQLMDTDYADTLQDISSEPVRTGPVESRLRQHMADGFRAPLRFLPAGTRELLDWRWRHLEIDNIKMILRGVERGASAERILSTLVPLGPGSEVIWGNLAQAVSVAAVVEQLRGTFYGRALRPALDQYAEEHRLFALEVRLDLQYHRRLLELVQRLGGQDRRAAERFLGFMIDSQNVLWALRYRIYYHLSPEEILNFTLIRGVRVRPSLMQEIAVGAAPVDVLEDVWDGKLGDLDDLRRLTQEQILARAESLFNRHVYEQAIKTLQGFPLSFGIVLAYHALLELEVYDLVTVLEGKAVGYAPDQIRAYLITPRGS
jgi:V/A-type H+-transporting ATPase subunit C